MKALLATLALTVAAPLAASAADLTLEVQGLDTTRLAGAHLMVAVFTDPATWLKQPAVGRRFAIAAAPDGRFTVDLKDLPEGPLAMSLFQDTNANGRLDANAMGMPTEPYGFSNNAAGNFGPPRFEQAVFTPVAGQPVRVTLN